MSISVETARVYNIGGRRYLSRSGAILGYARRNFFRKHPCTCERDEPETGYSGFTCEVHDAWERVKPRYLRVIRRLLKASQTP